MILLMLPFLIVENTFEIVCTLYYAAKLIANK